MIVGVVGLITAASVSGQAIQYRISPSTDMATLTVAMTIPCAGETLDLAMPVWAPGYYMLENYGEKLTGFSAVGDDGKPRTITHPKTDTWHIDTLGAHSVTVTYSRPVVHENGFVGIFSSDPQTIHYGGPSVYLYVEGRKKNRCEVFFDMPKTWDLAISLDPLGGRRFGAADYDTLADAPVTLGTFKTRRYIARGKEHVLAVRGQGRDRLDLDRAVKLTQFLTEAETDFFGKQAPYPRYVWHIWASVIPDGGGGLEHATSSQDFMAVTMGPAAVRGMAHEYFHLWNVKRIRSESLGPFDYHKLPRTGALWWLEGVTDYYASLIPHRYGWYDDQEYLKELSDQIQAQRSNPKRLEVSPFEGSFRVDEANNGRGNSNGFGVNYYPTGWILGMLFDIELRYRSGGKKSLDDVELALWKLCKDGKPGFVEGELRRQLMKVGGPEFGELYDQWVMRPGELPIEAALAKVGLVLGAKGVTVSPNASPAQVKLRESWFWGRKKRPATFVAPSKGTA